jgi:hypothetical protein
MISQFRVAPTIAFTHMQTMPLPRWVEPQPAKLVEKAPTGPQWVHEIKFDGWQIGPIAAIPDRSSEQAGSVRKRSSVEGGGCAKPFASLFAPEAIVPLFTQCCAGEYPVA